MPSPLPPLLPQLTVLEYDFKESVGYWMIVGAQAYQRALSDEVSPHGITFRQCQVLGFLALKEPMTQAELAEQMGIEPPTLVGVLDRMERDGWIRREPCTADRRRKLIYSTEAARPVWNKVVACARRVRERATIGLTMEQRATLKELLAVVQRNLGAKVLAEDKVLAEEEACDA